MNTTDTSLSISVKMAPGPNNRQEEPVTTNKNQDETLLSSSSSSSLSVNTNIKSIETSNSDIVINSNNISNPVNTNSDSSADKQEVTTLNERQLKALLDEAITYRGSTRDREAKSDLFKELLHEAQVDETEEGRRAVTSTRCIPGSNRRRHKRDSVSERLTHGGSLQNLAQSMNSEFDSSFAHLTSGSSHTYGGGRGGRKGKKHTGPSVSARQREGGSLPSNVNATHNLASFSNLDLIFDKKKSFCEERSLYDWANKEKSKSLDKPSYGSVTKKDDKDCKDRKENKPIAGCTNVTETEKKSTKVKQSTNEIVEPEATPMDCKPDFMVIDFEVNGIVDKNMVSGTISTACRGVEAGGEGNIQRAHSSLDNDDEEGTEMKIIEPRRPMQLISRANFETGQTPVDSAIEFPLRDEISKNEKPKIPFNGSEIQLQTYNNVKCVSNGGNSSGGGQQGKVMSSNLLPIMHVAGTQPNIAMAVSRITGSNITGRDTTSVAIDRKSLDENGNSLQIQQNGERKKSRRKNSQKPNVIVYSAENVAGHRYEKDIDSLLNFIENKDSKGGKKGKTTGGTTVKMNKTSSSSSSGEKTREKSSRTREKDSKRDQLSSKLQKSNSLEEISKTKLEDLTVDKNCCSSGESSPSSNHQHIITINGGLRRAKQRSTGDSVAIDLRGDRRSWGTEEGQSIYCNDIGNDYDSPNITRRNSSKKITNEIEQDTEFLVVTKKKKSKKQRRSSSGDRGNCSSVLVVNSSSYLPRSRNFTNDYRTQHSPELRRKSTSSMPPSDKSDSSDLDSVHSLPVTSNTKDNMNNKNSIINNNNNNTSPTSSSGTPQTSYADITKMAAMNLPNIPNSILNISNSPPTISSNTGNWQLCPDKSPSEPDKFPQDYYPSLDELQNDNKKYRQQNFSNSTSPTDSKLNNSIIESEKAEAREEAINKKIQVIKYVQEQKNLNENNTNANQNDKSPIILNDSLKYKNSSNIIINNSIDDVVTSDILLLNKDNSHSNKINSYARTTRKNISNYDLKKAASTSTSSDHYQDHQDVKSSKTEFNKKSLPQVQMELETQKQQQQQKSSVKNEKIVLNLNNSDVVISNSNKSEITKSSSSSIDLNKNDDIELKKLNPVNKMIKETKCDSTTRKNQRPAVILMDESSSDSTKNNDSSIELTFGFEINEQLLKSDGKEETKIISSVQQETPQIFDKPPPPFFGRPPPLFEKIMRCEKFPPNFHVPPPHLRPGQTPLLHSPINVPPTSYHMGYPPRFHLPENIYIGTPPVISSSINVQYQPKIDFSARYVEPEKAVDVQRYNHDKIVSFVGLAWDAVMREIPVTTTTGRVQYYSGQ